MDPVIALPASAPIAAARPSTAALPAARALAWLSVGWRVLRHAPLRILLLAFVPVLVEALCQAIPQAGIALSKLATPMVAALTWVLLERRVRQGAFAPAAAVRQWRARWPALAVVATLAFGVFLVQLGVAALLAGVDQARAIATGAMADLRMDRTQLAIMLVSGMIPGLALMTVQPRVVLDGRGVGAAIVDNAQALLRAWRPVALVTLATMGLVAAAMWWPVLLLPLFPFALTVGYAMYRDLHHAPVD